MPATQSRVIAQYLDTMGIPLTHYSSFVASYSHNKAQALHI